MDYLIRLMSHFQKPDVDTWEQYNLEKDVQKQKTKENNSEEKPLQRDKSENAMLLIEQHADTLKDYFTTQPTESIPDLIDSIDQLAHNVMDETKEHSDREIAKQIPALYDNLDHLTNDNVRDDGKEHNGVEIARQYDTLYHLAKDNIKEELKLNDLKIAKQISATDINEETLLKDILDVIGGNENLIETELNDKVDEPHSSSFTNYVNNSTVHDDIEDIFNLDEFDALMANTEVNDYDLIIKSFNVLRNVEEAEITEPLYINRTSTQIIDTNTNVLKENSVKTDDPIIDIDDFFEHFDNFTESGHRPEENMEFERKTDVSEASTKTIEKFETETLMNVLPFHFDVNSSCDIKMEQNNNVTNSDDMENGNGINKGTTVPNTVNNQNVITNKDTACKTEQIIKNIHQINENTKEIVIKVDVEIKFSTKTKDSSDNAHGETEHDSDGVSVISISSSDDIELVNIKENTTDGENKVQKNANYNITDICECSDEENVSNTAETIDCLKYLNAEHDSDDSNVYNSSDFEFISESEAEKDGLILNYYSRMLTSPDKNKIPEVYTEGIAIDHTSQGTVDMSLPGTSRTPYIDEPGPSNSNAQYYTYNAKYRHVLANQEPDYRQNHRIPEGDDYLNLFRGCFAPIMAGDLLENKCTKTMLSMNIEYEGVGFDMRLRRHEESDEYNDDADETKQKIASMYSAVNRKRRRRF